jgi:TolB-like protein
MRVQNIVEGGVRRPGNCIRVAQQFIHPADGYDCGMIDVFA